MTDEERKIQQEQERLAQARAYTSNSQVQYLAAQLQLVSDEWLSSPAQETETEQTPGTSHNSIKSLQLLPDYVQRIAIDMLAAYRKENDVTQKASIKTAFHAITGTPATARTLVNGGMKGATEYTPTPVTRNQSMGSIKAFTAGTARAKGKGPLRFLSDDESSPLAKDDRGRFPSDDDFGSSDSDEELYKGRGGRCSRRGQQGPGGMPKTLAKQLMEKCPTFSGILESRTPLKVRSFIRAIRKSWPASWDRFT